MAAGPVAVVCNIVERTEEDTAGNCTRTAAAVEQHTAVEHTAAYRIVVRTDPWEREWVQRKSGLHWCRFGLE